MWYWIIPLIGAVCLIVGFGGWSILSAKQSSTGASTVVKSVTVTTNRFLTRGELRDRLQKLAESAPINIEYQPGAMCYKVAAPPNRIEYVCPVDGHKTLYTNSQAIFIYQELFSMRNYVNAITNIRVRLDESEFCKVCTPEATDPKIYLEIRYGKDEPVHRVALNSADDLSPIYQFLNGRQTYGDGYDGETPMKTYLVRLQQLLGIKLQ